MRSFYSGSPEETESLAESFAKELVFGDVIAYKGDLGAGKTAFTRGLAKGLGIDPDLVSSPTFALLNIYEGEAFTLYHFDMYRVTGFESLESTGFFDYLGGEGVLAVEWSENIEPELPPDAINITITPLSESGRRIEIQGGRF